MLPEASSLGAQNPDLVPRDPKPRVSPPPPPPLQFQSWLHDEILAEFLNHCLPLGATQEVPLSWLRSLMPMKKEIDALPLAMSALAIGWAGHTNGEPQLIDKGLQLYNAAVRQLRDDIQGRSPLQVLATTVIFTIYELFEFGSEQSHGWLCHVSGIAATLRLLGPSRVASEPYLQIFNFVRMIYVGLSGHVFFGEGSYADTLTADDSRVEAAASSLCRGTNVEDNPLRPVRKEPVPQILRSCTLDYGAPRRSRFGRRTGKSFDCPWSF